MTINARILKGIVFLYYKKCENFLCYVLVSVVAAPVEMNEEEDTDYDDASFFHAKCVYSGPFNNLRWSSRVFAVECVCHIVVQCESRHPAHFDMALAQEQRLHKSAGQSRHVKENWEFLSCSCHDFNLLTPPSY